MIIDEKIREKLIENYTKNLENIITIYNDFINTLKTVKTVEEKTESKKMFLINYLHNIPLKANYCYFCLENPYCVACPYAKYHKNCNSGNSDWKDINDMRNDLMIKIETEYYRGEEY